MNKENAKIFEQDLNNKNKSSGTVFAVHLLMNKICSMPDKQLMQNIINKHLGETDCFCYYEKTAGFAVKKYSVNFEKDNGNIPPMLMITECSEIKKPVMDEISASQLWDCPDGSEILKNCRYQVIATDMLASGLYYKGRAEMLVDYIEALAELYPSCIALVFETSKKMLSREDIIKCCLPKEKRFIYYAVNVRFFNIQNTEDMLIDTIGMSTLFMPDL
ncbi:MAG: hypothetical protein SPE43_10605 [Ruminococcus sp.]|nr:hypothetical protein [Oscillospiraceae bacterium]MDY4414795.1 hypothetical protein [Ruminococcus sp.]